MDAQSFLKRGTPSLWPHEIKVVEDPAHPLYDERLDLPVSDSAIRNFAVRGQVQPVAVRVDGKDLVLVEGRQRWKRAVVINHVSGAQVYKGKIKAVHDAIAGLEGSDLATLIADRCPNGIKLRFDVFRGTAQAASAAAVAANEHREDDGLELKIRKAQRLAAQSFSAEDIVEEFAGRVSLATVKRWLAVDLSKPKAKKARSTTKKPGAKKLAALYDHVASGTGSAVGATATHALGWAMGRVTWAQLVEVIPELAGG